MTTTPRARYKGYRFPVEIIGHAVWLYFRFPLGLRIGFEPAVPLAGPQVTRDRRLSTPPLREEDQ